VGQQEAKVGQQVVQLTFARCASCDLWPAACKKKGVFSDSMCLGGRSKWSEQLAVLQTLWQGSGRGYEAALVCSLSERSCLL
jgi:hypothetical protein